MHFLRDTLPENQTCGSMKTLIIGIGNEYRGDDGVGRQVARRLASLDPPNVEIQESSGESFSLMELWSNAPEVILIDAVQSGAEPGTVQRFDAGTTPLPTGFVQQCSTHALSLPEAIEMARSLEQLPPKVILYGIEGLRFEHGNILTPTVARAAEETVGHILQEISQAEPERKR